VRDAWACRSCGRVCSDKREAHADHIVPIAEGGERYDVTNGQTLCVRCHGRKTRREQAKTAACASLPAETCQLQRSRAGGRVVETTPT